MSERERGKKKEERRRRRRKKKKKKKAQKKPLRRDQDLKPQTLSPEPSVLSIRPRRPALIILELKSPPAKEIGTSKE